MRRSRTRSLCLAPLGALALLPGLAQALCAPSVEGIFPASGIVGTSVTATVRGEALSDASVSVFGDAGLQVTPQANSATALTLRLDVAADAPLGERILVIETPGGIAGASFTVNGPGGLIVAEVTPTPIATRGLGLDLVLTGSAFDLLVPANVSVSGTGVSVAGVVPAPDGSMLDLMLDVAPDAELGARAIEIRSSSVGGAVLQMVVQRPAPSVAVLSPAAGAVGTIVPITITGADLAGGALVITGSGVTVSATATPDDATLTATLTIGPGVSPSPEPRLLIVTTDAGQTTVEFFVVAAGAPTVTSVLPGAGEPGESLIVTLRGLGFTGVSSVTSSSAELVVNGFTPVDDETIDVDVDVVGPTTNVNRTLTVTVGADTAPGTFRVIPPGTPFFNAVRPPFGNRGSTITVVLDGVNLADTTDIDIDHNAIAESNAQGLDDRTARVVFEIGPNANIGSSPAITVTTPGGSFSKDPAFRVNVPGQVPSITDVSPRLVESGVPTLITVTGSNFDGGSALVTGPGATVTNVMVSGGGTIMTFELSIDPAAPPQSRAVIVVTQNGTARCGVGVLVGGPALVAAKLVKTGALFQVASTGFRLLVFEFSMAPDFPDGPRTLVLASPEDDRLVLTRRDVERIRRAFRDRHRGFVRVTGVTATNLFGTSDSAPIRR
jgi:hypothetical protein